MSGHTSGPWTVWQWENESVARLCVGPGKAGIAVCTFFDGDLEELPDAEANARLIAAAPELLAALKKCLAQLEIVLPESGRVHDETQAMIDGYAAIAKSEGPQ